MEPSVPSQLLDLKTQRLILFTIACATQDSIVIRHHCFEARKLGRPLGQLKEVVELMRKNRTRFRRETELVS